MTLFGYQSGISKWAMMVQTGARAIGHVLLLSILVAAAGCGSKSKDKLLGKISDAQEKIRLAESQTSATDAETLRILRVNRENLESAQALIIEADYLEASKLTDAVIAELDRILDQGTKNKRGAATQEIEAFGQVECRVKGGTEFKELIPSLRLTSVEALRTAIRSGVKLNLPGGSTITLPSRTEIEIERVSKGKRKWQFNLISGTALVAKASRTGPYVMRMGDFQASAEGKVDFELANQPILQSRYLAVFEGSLSWSEGDDSGSLPKFQGLRWVDGKPTPAAVPATLNLDSPKPYETISTGGGPTSSVVFRWFSQSYIPEYQLQISDHVQFVTRIFDKTNLTRGEAVVDLPVGEYYWRVRGFSEDRVPGAFTKVMVLYVTKEASPAQKEAGAQRQPTPVGKGPKVSNLKVEVISSMVIVSGKTSERARVRVNGESAVMLDRGKFRAIINFSSSGVQTMRISATDTNTGATSVLEEKVLIP